jgi:hypothetical protein
VALSFGPHFERGIECLVKESIIPPLEFLDFEKCIDCNIKKIKKNEKQSA